MKREKRREMRSRGAVASSSTMPLPRCLFFASFVHELLTRRKARLRPAQDKGVISSKTGRIKSREASRVHGGDLGKKRRGPISKDLKRSDHKTTQKPPTKFPIVDKSFAIYIVDPPAWRGASRPRASAPVSLPGRVPPLFKRSVTRSGLRSRQAGEAEGTCLRQSSWDRTVARAR